MKFVTYNIQFGLGKDQRIDLARIADTVRNADVIALQEVERNWPRTGMADQPAELARLLPEYHWVYGPAFDVDASAVADDGTVTNRRRQHGVMLLSKTRILSSRLYTLPKFVFPDHFNMQIGALETVIETAAVPLRVYSIHLGYLAGDERLVQLEDLLGQISRAPGEGGAWTGPSGIRDQDWSAGEPLPPLPEEVILLGDFNSTPGSPEYQRVAGPNGAAGKNGAGYVDTWVAAGHDPAGSVTWLAPPGDPEWQDRRLDYCFVSRGFADQVAEAWVDSAAQGSDHQPVWTTLDL